MPDKGTTFATAIAQHNLRAIASVWKLGAAWAVLLAASATLSIWVDWRVGLTVFVAVGAVVFVVSALTVAKNAAKAAELLRQEMGARR